MNYASIAFTEAVKQLQAANGSRHSYERMEKNRVTDGLSQNEVAFIEEQDHFFMASFGENEYPYIQHRGGPKGFLKVLDSKTLAFVDFSGNKQYISVGNMQTNPNISIILLSYPHQARLKIYAKARVVALDEAPDLFAKIDLADYPHRPERLIVMDIQAYDWNCPQHIIPRYTVEEIQVAFESQNAYISNLEAEIQALKEQLKHHQPFDE